MPPGPAVFQVTRWVLGKCPLPPADHQGQPGPVTTQRASHALGPDFAGVALVTLVVLEFAIDNARPEAEELPGWIAAGVEDASPSKLCLLAGALGFGGGGLEGAMAAWALWELKELGVGSVVVGVFKAGFSFQHGGLIRDWCGLLVGDRNWCGLLIRGPELIIRVVRGRCCEWLSP